MKPRVPRRSWLILQPLPTFHHYTFNKNPKNICTGHTSPPGSPPKKTPQTPTRKSGVRRSPSVPYLFRNERLWDDFFWTTFEAMEAAAPSLFCALAALGLRWQHGQFTTAGGNASWEPRRSFINMGFIWGNYINGLIINGFHWELFHQKYKWSYFTISKRAFWWAARLVPWEC